MNCCADDEPRNIRHQKARDCYANMPFDKKALNARKRENYDRSKAEKQSGGSLSCFVCSNDMFVQEERIEITIIYLLVHTACGTRILFQIIYLCDRCPIMRLFLYIFLLEFY